VGWKKCRWRRRWCRLRRGACRVKRRAAVGKVAEPAKRVGTPAKRKYGTGRGAGVVVGARLRPAEKKRRAPQHGVRAMPKRCSVKAPGVIQSWGSARQPCREAAR